MAFTLSASSSSPVDSRLPVTLLSGFLGSGKTTLLEHILRGDHGLKCAVIVNDIGALNIDDALLKSHSVLKKSESVIAMQNGCICCTLRGDLLEEIADLASRNEFQYLLIESTGISEPMQVSETWTTEFNESIEELEASLPETTTPESRSKIAALLANGGLDKISRLDTCVTVVDATTFLSDFDTTDFLSDRHAGQVTPEDERNITDLLVDQIEFADVLLINKMDLVDAETIARVHRVVAHLNPSAKVIETMRSKVDLKEILNTGRFSFEKAATGAGWLQSLKETNQIAFTDVNGITKMVPKPETVEYGISSFVYRARKPFHPERLWNLISKPFVVIQNDFEEGEEEDDDDDDKSEGSSASGSDSTMATTPEPIEPQLDLPGRLAEKRASPIFKSLLRSKGFAWLATRPRLHGEWSQAGVMFSFTGGSRWMCEEPEESWPMSEDPKVVEAIKADFDGQWGDRRQEIVFIGESLDVEAVTKAVDACLLTEAEWRMWQRVMSSKRSYPKKLERLNQLYNDGFEEWFDLDEEVEEAHGHSHATMEKGIKRARV